jgi:hypothetical protein
VGVILVGLVVLSVLGNVGSGNVVETVIDRIPKSEVGFGGDIVPCVDHDDCGGRAYCNPNNHLCTCGGSSGFVYCFDVEDCVYIYSDENHCGNCQTQCGSNMVCELEVCQCDPNIEGLEQCGDDCIDVLENDNNCGGCGVECSVHGECNGGDCECNEDFAPDECDNNGEHFCTDFSIDGNNCGGCGNVCEGELVCVEGECDCFLETETQCGDQCVNLNWDEDHCGACDDPCAENVACISGECSECEPGYDPCDGICVDLDTDENNCGACGVVCPDGAHCENGDCVEDEPQGCVEDNPGCLLCVWRCFFNAWK